MQTVSETPWALPLSGPEPRRTLSAPNPPSGDRAGRPGITLSRQVSLKDAGAARYEEIEAQWTPLPCLQLLPYIAMSCSVLAASWGLEPSPWLGPLPLVCPRL